MDYEYKWKAAKKIPRKDVCATIKELADCHKDFEKSGCPTKQSIRLSTSRLNFFGIWPWFVCTVSISSSSVLSQSLLGRLFYRVLKLLILWGWSCCHICCCCTAICWDWSEVDSNVTSDDTQFAGMIKPVRKKIKNRSVYIGGLIKWKIHTLLLGFLAW